MKNEPKGPQAARLRQRKFELLHRFSISTDLLPGSLSVSHLRCGKPTCHCADSKDPGHSAWSFTFMVEGMKHVEHIPKAWVDEVRRRVRAGREFQDAVREVLAANAQLLVLAKKQKLKQPGKELRLVACGSMSAGRSAYRSTCSRPGTGGGSRRFQPKF